MSDDAVDAVFVEQPGSALAVREEPQTQAPALFGTTDPVEVVQNAVRVADALKDVIVKKKLVSNIQGREYPLVEGWQTLAAMLRLTTVCEWTRRIEEGEGWEARVIVRDTSGSVIGAAEAQCTRGERTWKSRDDYALRSMAQTRATSKALRSVLGFIMVLAGYQATPAEEMPPADPPPNPPPNEGPRYSAEGLKRRIFALCNELKIDDDERHLLQSERYGAKSLNDLTIEQLLDFGRHLASLKES